MCDFSLHAVDSRPLKLKDILMTHNFGGTIGFRHARDPRDHFQAQAICVMPGTEIEFAEPAFVRQGFIAAAVSRQYRKLTSAKRRTLGRVATFTQINLGQELMHHDALQFEDGKTVLLHHLAVGQNARVLTMPTSLATRAKGARRRRARIEA